MLDAAEGLFVQRGYYGVSLRDISREAGVQVALCYYHFGAKEDLFRAVIDRRSSANVQGLADALQAVQQQPAADLETRLQNVLRAFLKPIVEKSLRGGEGWRNYVRLLAQVAQLPQEETFLRPATDQSDAVVMLFIDELRKILPAMSAEDLHWSFYFYQAAITHVLVESGIVDRQSQGLCKASDLDTIVEKMTRFFSAGFLAMSSVITEPALKAGY
ncbi:TetR/AcrR family transcriptional regulator [Pseudomaricurvus alcaniphilus]|uniref:TetR/AcrR family transcriptional regulator n=1 Tax=Pseudomaricurvus alcaniphilus TaxID=1166482 RepID=UPI0031330518